MKITITHEDWDDYGVTKHAYSIRTDFGWQLYASEGMEPEDARFYRDLPDISTIKFLLAEVIAAVKRGEEVIIKEEEITT